MKIKNKWLLLAAALVILTVTWLKSDFSAYQHLSIGDLVPVMLIASVIFLFKTGILSTLLFLLKKLWERIRRKH